MRRRALVAAGCGGDESTQRRGITNLLPLDPGRGAALAALADGKTGIALARFRQLDERLAAFSGREADARLALRARSRLIAITESIARHTGFFDGGEDA